MIKRYIYVLAFVALSVFIAGCGKDDNVNDSVKNQSMLFNEYFTGDWVATHTREAETDINGVKLVSTTLYNDFSATVSGNLILLSDTIVIFHKDVYDGDIIGTTGITTVNSNQSLLFATASGNMVELTDGDGIFFKGKKNFTIEYVTPEKVRLVTDEVQTSSGGDNQGTFVVRSFVFTKKQ
jgi:hypothetical protein